MRILFAVTSPTTAKAFLAEQLRFQLDQGNDVHLICAPGAELATLDPRVHHHALPMTREPRVFQDLRAFIRVLTIIRGARPDVTVVSTPKAGLLVGLAAAALRVRKRYYLLRGLRYETTKGARRVVLMALEVVSMRCATDVVAVSHSLADKAYTVPGTGHRRPMVLGSGSSKGVDTQRFSPRTAETQAAAREDLGLPSDCVTFGFVGRLTRDKGLFEFIEAAHTLMVRPDVRFVAIGDWEERYKAPEVRAAMMTANIVVREFASDPTVYYPAIDVLVLPTHREGFPNVVLEAAACAIPTITTLATGARDSVVDRVTGLLIEIGDAKALVDAIVELADESDLRVALGRAARQRVLEEFESASTVHRYGLLWAQEQ